MQFTKLDRNFSVSPQLRADDLALAAEAGFCTIVNNRPDGEEEGQPSDCELRSEARRLGLAYAYIPIVPGQRSDAEAAALNAVIAQSAGPVLAFCRSGARSTSLWKRSRELPGRLA